jgi:dipeptidyl aminopeptidase/acylaminoacyl peptidase
MFQYWSDDAPLSRVFSYHFSMYLSDAQHGAADIHEMFRVARNIRAGNVEDWHVEFARMGERVEAIAHEALKAQHEATASESYFRAFMYYRLAELRLPHTDARKIPTYRKSIACYEKGIALSTYPHEAIKVPYDGHELAGYFFSARDRVTRKPAPCVIFLAGADQLPEGNLFRGAQYITARGSSCLIFNGPGQGSSLRLLGLPTIPDYERPVSAAVDYLMTRNDVDHDRIGLMGISMAGYYAPRAACFEHRIKALVVWSALYDVLNDLYETHPPLQSHLQWIVGAKNDQEARQKFAPFTLKGLASKIRCPVLVTHGELDHMVPVASAQRLYDELSVKEKKLRIYTDDEGGATHASVDNYSQVVPYQIDWLLDHLR